MEAHSHSSDGSAAVDIRFSAEELKTLLGPEKEELFDMVMSFTSTISRDGHAGPKSYIPIAIAGEFNNWFDSIYCSPSSIKGSKNLEYYMMEYDDYEFFTASFDLLDSRGYRFKPVVVIPWLSVGRIPKFDTLSEEELDCFWIHHSNLPSKKYPNTGYPASRDGDKEWYLTPMTKKELRYDGRKIPS